jgi:hypothetical protein
MEKIMMKKLLMAAIVAASFGGVAVPASADILVRVAPPAPRVEVVPEARRGYVWAPGYWDWKRGHHVWVKGKWVRERRGYVYKAPTWEEHNGRWRMHRGNWARHDRDGDGVPNGMDNRPNNPNRN